MIMPHYEQDNLWRLPAGQEGALAAAAALGSVGRLAGHAAGLGMLAGGTTRSINAFSTWSISVLPPSIATEHICPVLRSTINPFPPVYTHAHLWLLPAGLRMPRTRPHELAWPWQPRSGRCQPRQNTHDKGQAWHC